MPLRYVLDLAGVAVFAVSGALAAGHAGVGLIVALRLGGIYGGWHLPVLRLPA